MSNYKHGKRFTRLYGIWCGMKDRCHNKNSKYYEIYGGRGIVVCVSWRIDFKIFHEWAMNNGYKDNLQIYRIDPDRGYNIFNCRWVTPKQQQNNRRNNRRIVLSLTVAEWAEFTGLSYKTITNRQDAGLEPREILSTKGRVKYAKKI